MVETDLVVQPDAYLTLIASNHRPHFELMLGLAALQRPP
jgi:hypothetical protein